MADPSPFLSTIASSSAAMVAIVGGLLVAKFVTVDSEQEGAQHLLRDAKERLIKARERECQAREVLRAIDLRYFFTESVLDKIYIKSVKQREAINESDLAEYKRLRDPGRLTDEDIAQEVNRRALEFPKACQALERLGEPSSKLFEFNDWEHFKSQEPTLQDVELDDVWSTVFKILRQKDYSSRMADGLMGLATMKPAVVVARDMQRHDARRDDVDQATRVVEDLEAEVVRLQKARDAIGRPKGLGVGLVVLAVFTAIGVIYPVWLMAHAPKDLTRSITYPVFGAFAGGLALLLGYMGWLALRLSGWFQKRKTDKGM